MNSNRLSSDIKGFLKDKINILVLLILISNVIYIIGMFIVFNHLVKIEHAINKCEKKVDFRYFNLTKSLEEIHNTDIDTKDGRIRITLQTLTNR